MTDRRRSSARSRVAIAAAALLLTMTVPAGVIGSTSVAPLWERAVREVGGPPPADVPASPVEASVSLSEHPDVGPPTSELWLHDDGFLAKPPIWTCQPDAELPQVRSEYDMSMRLQTPFPIWSPSDDDHATRGIARIDGDYWLIPQLDGPDEPRIDEVTASFHPLYVRNGDEDLQEAGVPATDPEELCDRLDEPLPNPVYSTPSTLRVGDGDGPRPWVMRVDTRDLTDGIYVLALRAWDHDFELRFGPDPLEDPEGFAETQVDNAEAVGSWASSHLSPVRTVLTYAFVATEADAVRATTDNCGTPIDCGVHAELPPRWPSIRCRDYFDGSCVTLVVDWHDEMDWGDIRCIHPDGTVVDVTEPSASQDPPQDQVTYTAGVGTLQVASFSNDIASRTTALIVDGACPRDGTVRVTSVDSRGNRVVTEASLD